VEEETRTGDLIWRAEIDEWQEIVPWVRQWGADCEALEPKELREELMGETKALAERYGWFVSSQPSGKSSTLDEFFGDR